MTDQIEKSLFQQALLGGIQACINSYEGEYGEVKPLFVSEEKFKSGHTQGIFGYDDRGTLFIVFQGSNEWMDWKDNFKFHKQVIPYEGVNERVKVHEGFISQYKTVRNIIHSRVRKIAGAGWSVCIIGHSLGGALATLCAVDIQYNFPGAFSITDGKLSCITFGSPRVGNASFAASYDVRVPHTIRVVNGEDMITKLPPEWFGFVHVGKKHQIGDKHWYGRIGIGSTDDHYPQRYLENIK